MANQWQKFFAGTPKRLLATASAVSLLLAFAYHKPDVLQRSISNLIGAFCAGIGPFLTPILTMLIIAYGINRFRKTFWK